MLTEELSDGTSDSNASGTLDVVSSIAYDSNFRLCKEYIEKAAHLHLEFWGYLRDERPDIAKLNECGSKINSTIHQVEQYWG